MTKDQKQKFKKYFLDYQKHYIRNKRLCNLSEKDEKFDQKEVAKARNNMHSVIQVNGILTGTIQGFRQ